MPQTTFREKEQAIIRRLQETDYALFDGDRDEALDTLGEALMQFPDYVNTVIKMEIMIPIWRARCEPEDFRERVTDIDRSRHHAHEATIANVGMLNRISGMLGLPPYADIDITDRQAVADLAGQYVAEVYRDGIGKGIDDAVMGRKQEYPRKTATDRLKSLEREMAGIEPGGQEEETVLP